MPYTNLCTPGRWAYYGKSGSGSDSCSCGCLFPSFFLHASTERDCLTACGLAAAGCWLLVTTHKILTTAFQPYAFDLSTRPPILAHAGSRAKEVSSRPAAASSDQSKHGPSSHRQLIRLSCVSCRLALWLSSLSGILGESGGALWGVGKMDSRRTRVLACDGFADLKTPIFIL